MKLNLTAIKREQRAKKCTKAKKVISYQAVENRHAGNNTNTWGIVFYR